MTCCVRPSWCALFAVLGCASAALAVQNQDQAKLAVTDLVEVDGDFAYQGEYLGAVSPYGWGAENLGLQVIALGDGQFSAVLLQGGLPGAGWDREQRIELAGGREDGQVTLRGDRYTVTVRGVDARVYDAATGRAAVLPKIHRVSFTQGLTPPPSAIVLFDGTSTDQFENAKTTPDGLLEVGPLTRMPVGDFRLHLEFRTPYMPYARGQGRGNSGVYVQQRYEVQILDSFGLEGVENECGGLYRQKRPDVNMCLPPLAWQTYDIYFTSARFHEDGSKRVPARLTVLHNGQLIHTVYDLANKTGAGKPESPEPRPILLQNHGNPVHFRNIWIIPGVPKSDLRVPGYFANPPSAAVSTTQLFRNSVRRDVPSQDFTGIETNLPISPRTSSLRTF
jgi:hypothetical protein